MITNKKLLNNLINQFLEINSKEYMLDFLQGILTPSELEELPRRLEIIRQLKKGTPQLKISENMGVGIATVTRGSRELKRERFKVVKINENE